MMEQVTFKDITCPLAFVGIIAVLILLTSGCSNPNAGRYAYLSHQNYMNQQRMGTFEEIKVQEGGEYSQIIKGPATVTRSMPLRELATIPKEPNVANTAIEWLGRLGLGWVVGEAFASATAGPTVVNTPAPQIVRPEVIQVPFAPAP